MKHFLMALFVCVCQISMALGQTQALNKEPELQSESPRYLCLKVGIDPQSIFWVVQDGNRCHIDLNGDGVITDSSETVPIRHCRLGQEGYVRLRRGADSSDYSLEMIFLPDGCVRFGKARIGVTRNADGYAWTTCEGEEKVIRLGRSPDTAPVLCFDGETTLVPLTETLRLENGRVNVQCYAGCSGEDDWFFSRISSNYVRSPQKGAYRYVVKVWPKVVLAYTDAAGVGHRAEAVLSGRC